MVLAQMQPERDHKLTEERTDVREQNNRATRQRCERLDGVRHEVDGPTDLVLTYWGNERSARLRHPDRRQGDRCG